MLEKYVLCIVLEFTDGISNIMELCRGSIEKCEEIAEKIPAVVNSTGKMVKESYLSILVASEFDVIVSENKQETPVSTLI